MDIMLNLFEGNQIDVLTIKTRMRRLENRGAQYE